MLSHSVHGTISVSTTVVIPSSPCGVEKCPWAVDDALSSTTASTKPASVKMADTVCHHTRTCMLSMCACAGGAESACALCVAAHCASFGNVGWEKVEEEEGTTAVVSATTAGELEVAIGVTT